MREIKFRALAQDEEWRYGEYPHISPEMSNTIYSLDVFWHLFLTLFRRDTLGQYTGLKDKNGKEIYDGDIVNNRRLKHPYIVLFLSGDFILNNPACCSKCREGIAIHGSLYGYTCPQTANIRYVDLLCTSENTEVIGNIYNNPELIKERKSFF